MSSRGRPRTRANLQAPPAALLPYGERGLNKNHPKFTLDTVKPWKAGPRTNEAAQWQAIPIAQLYWNRTGNRWRPLAATDDWGIIHFSGLRAPSQAGIPKVQPTDSTGCNLASNEKMAWAKGGRAEDFDWRPKRRGASQKAWATAQGCCSLSNQPCRPGYVGS